MLVCKLDALLAGHQRQSIRLLHCACHCKQHFSQPDPHFSSTPNIYYSESAVCMRLSCQVVIVSWITLLTLTCFMQALPLHNTHPHASLTSDPDKPNATLRSTTRCYSPDWLLSHQHHRQQGESPSAPQDMRDCIGEDLWAPGWQSRPFQSSSSHPGSSQASPLHQPPPHTPHGVSQGGGAAKPSAGIAHSDKGKGVLFFHGHIPGSNSRCSADAGAMGQEAALSHKHKLEDMALNEPLRFVDRNGMATPFFRKVSSLQCIYI